MIAGPVTQSARFLAHEVRRVLGGTPRVTRLHHGAGSAHVDVAQFADVPAVGWTAYATLTLHQVPNVLEDEDIRVELSGVAASHVAAFADLMADLAFRVSREGHLAAPGVVFEDAVDASLSRALRHVMWTPPLPWPDLASVTVPDGPEVHWLLAVPIADSEYEFLLQHGFDAFEGLLDANRADYFDLDRAAVV